jgi:hypothetical protein
MIEDIPVSMVPSAVAGAVVVIVFDDRGAAAAADQ